MLSIWLYGKPNWDLPIEGKKKFDPLIFRKHAVYMKNHMDKVAYSVRKLQYNKWSAMETYGAIYSIDLFKDTTIEQAKKEIKVLNIPKNIINIEEVR